MEYADSRATASMFRRSNSTAWPRCTFPGHESLYDEPEKTTDG
jgi:hypothetical protein